MLSFRTPLKGYGNFNPGFLEKLGNSVLAINLVNALEGAPYGWDIENLQVIIYGDEATVAIPIYDDSAEQNHIADCPVMKLAPGWEGVCCFPLIVFTGELGEC